MNSYHTNGTCSKQILFDVTDDLKLTNVKFIGGCSGNLQAIAKLVEGKPIDEVVSLLSGIKCRGNTSCGDQLARALIGYKEKNGIK
ncbi:MAG: TIGR03905 family TSCPD domain-containing protein [Clostridiales bacterium]|nr:TIGR03905 family TSCPD domain-containing protein [Clostridiales bacterium]